MSDPAGADFYIPLDAAPAYIAQGDIYLCPSSALLSAEGLEIPPGTPPAPRVDDIGSPLLVSAWESGAGEGAAAPPVAHEGRWGPVMVISHECDLQKDFSALARVMMREEGLTRDQVEERLSGRVDLDRYAVVAPVLSLDDLPMQWAADLRTEQRLGDVRRGARMDFFPLPAHPEGHLPESVVSFVRLATVERRLLDERRRYASLSEPARSVLRYKLGFVFSMRDASVIAEIEAAVGQRIIRTGVSPIPQKKNEKKTVSITIHLENGEVLHLQGAPIREGMPEGPSRAL